MSKRIHQYIKQIDIPTDIVSIQKTAILRISYEECYAFKKLGRFQMSRLTYLKVVIIITTIMLIIISTSVN